MFCFLSNGAILDDLGARFKVKAGDDMFPREKLSREILILVEVCALWVNYCYYYYYYSFLLRVSILTRDIDIANLSVCPSVCYVPVSDENGLTYRHSFFHHTVAQ